MNFRANFKEFQLLSLIICLFILAQTGAANAEDETISVSVGPNVWFAQPAVIIGEGWDREAHLILEARRYPGPANMLQAFAAGEIDGMNNNMAAAMLIAARGIPIRFVSGTFQGDINLLADGELLALRRSLSPEQALKQYSEKLQRRLRLVTNPRGSFSDLTARYWLTKSFPNFSQYVEISHAADQAQLQQLYLSGNADLIAGFAPLPEILAKKRPGVGFFAQASELMDPQPGGALVVRASYQDQYPTRISRLQSLYQRATQLMLDDPDRCAVHIEKYLMQGLLSAEIIAKVLRDNRRFLITDLAPLRDATQRIHDFMVSEKYLTSPVDLDFMFTGIKAQ